MPRKPGRPKEEKRVPLLVRVKAKTEKAIRKALNKSDPTRNTLGKVIDERFI